MSEEDAGTGESEQGLSESYQSAKNSIFEAKNAVESFLEGVSQWIERRTRLTQLFIAGGVSWSFTEGISLSNATWGALQAAIPSFTTPQLLLALIGLVLLQTTVQARKFNQLEYVPATEEMDSETRADGGRARDEQGRFKKKDGGSSGGGAIGGAIAGGALGASFGPGGAAFGAIMGAILGDEIEKGGDD